MGQLSWMYADVLGSMPIGVTQDSYLLVPERFQDKYGEWIKEECYDGHSNMGGYDVYELVAEWNREDLYYYLFTNEGDENITKIARIYTEFGEDVVESYLSTVNYFNDEWYKGWKRILGLCIALHSEWNACLPYPIKIVSSPIWGYDEVESSDNAPIPSLEDAWKI